MMRLGDDARFYGVVVQVLQFLPEHRIAAQFDGMIAVLPELIVPIISTTTAIIFEHVHEPFPSAFMQVRVHGLDNGTGREALEVAHHKVERILLCAADEVKVIGHDDIGVQFQVFVLLTISDAVIKDVNILLPCKNIYPTDHRCGGVVKLARPCLIACGHGVKISKKNRADRLCRTEEPRTVPNSTHEAQPRAGGGDALPRAFFCPDESEVAHRGSAD